MLENFRANVLNGKQNSLTAPVNTRSFEKRAPGQVEVILSKLEIIAARYSDRCEICLRARYSSEVTKIVK